MPSSLPPETRAFLAENAARREIWHVRIEIVQTAVILTLVGVVAWLGVRTPDPIVIRVDDVGRADAVAYEETGWSGLTDDVRRRVYRYTLAKFVTQYFNRIRSTAVREHPEALLFLTRDLAQQLQPAAVE